MSENVGKPREAAERARACKRLSLDQWAKMSREERREYHRALMALRRRIQLARKSDSFPVRSSSIATGNRHGGAHQHGREIARRLRQQNQRSAHA